MITKKQRVDLTLALLGATNAETVRMKNVVRMHVKRVMDAADGNLSVAAEVLGMHRRSLQRYLRRLERKPRRRRGRRS